MRRHLFILLVSLFVGMIAGRVQAEDPLVAALEALAKERTAQHESSSTISESETISSNNERLLSDYPFKGRLWRLHETRRETPPLPVPSSASTNEIQYYHPSAGGNPPRPSPEATLALKRIVEPLPQDYAQVYLKLKTLLNPTRTYVQVHIDKSRQRMWVYLDNRYIGDWKVSTARRGYWTPVGVYRPYTLHRMHYSRKYHHSPMPWSVFFKGGYAIHGTNAIRRLGRPASHGCVRVHPRNAKKLYQLIKRYGKQNTRIIIRG